MSDGREVKATIIVNISTHSSDVLTDEDTQELLLHVVKQALSDLPSWVDTCCVSRET